MALLDWLIRGRSLPGSEKERASPLAARPNLDVIGLKLTGVSAEVVPSDRRLLLVTAENEADVVLRLRESGVGRNAAVSVTALEQSPDEVVYGVTVIFDESHSLCFDVRFWRGPDGKMECSWELRSIT